MTMQKKVKHTSRRNVFTVGLRYVTAGLLALAGGAAIVKRRRLLFDGKCVNRNVCRDCRIFNECGLPLALSTRQAHARSDNG